MQSAKRILAFTIPVAAGLAVLVGLVVTRPRPEQAPFEERSVPVRVISVPRVDMVPRVRAYGIVQPGRTWNAVAEVGGKVVEVNPQLEAGAFLKADSVLLRIDPTDYELAIAQRQADIEATEARLRDNEVREANSRRSLAIEKEALVLSRSELERRRRLVRQGAASQSAVEQQEREVLVQQQNVTSHENALALLPPERASLEAQLARYEAQLAEAQRNLERTVIRLPFAARISRVEVERNQSVQPGEVLAVADDIATAEIEAEIPLQVVRNVMTSGTGRIEQLPQDIGNVLGIDAFVRLPDFDIEWPGRLVRMSPTLHPETRTIGAIVEVDEPYRGVVPGLRPPLVKEMFVEVELRAQPRPGTIVIPRTALHESNVYLVDGEGRLRIQPVAVSLIQPEFVAIATGLEPGDLLVVSQLVPAVEGMRLSPHADEATRAHLIRMAEGQQ